MDKCRLGDRQPNLPVTPFGCVRFRGPTTGSTLPMEFSFGVYIVGDI